jgi:dUTP pyrophosphatase
MVLFAIDTWLFAKLNNMRIKIKRFDKELPLPVYKTDGAVCMDLCVREEHLIVAKGIGYLPLNIAIEVPQGYFTILAARSSTHKMGLMPINGIGMIDSDYKGDNDELLFAAYNFTDKDVLIEKGTRVAQLVVLKYDKIEFEEVEHLESTDRGGFGSTGKK